MSGLMLGKYVDGAGKAHFIEVAVDESGRVLSAVLPLTDAQMRAAAVQVEPLGRPSIATQVVVTNVTADTVLTATCRRISIKARTCDMRYVIGVGVQIANASTSHFIEAGERLDLAIPLNGHIAVIRDTAATADGKLCITELV